MRHLRHHLRLQLIVPLGVFLLAGCQKEKVARAPEPPVQNALTDIVANGVTGMNKAESTANTENARIQETEKQAQSVQEP